MTEIEKIEAEIKVLQKKLELLKEIETHKSQPKMEFSFGGKFEVVSYNGMVYYRLEFPNEFYWYKRKYSDEGVLMVAITDGETYRLLEGLWFNEVKHGKYDEPYCPDEPDWYDEVEWDEKDNPKPAEEVLDRLEDKYEKYGGTSYMTDEVIDRVMEKWKTDPPEFLKFELGKTMEQLVERWWQDVFMGINSHWDMKTAIDDLVDRIQLWLPREQDSSGTQSIETIISVDTHNELLRKIKSKLRNKNV